MSTNSDRSYKRSWRNLLLNKSYQLRFTLFMVGLSTALMVGLGIWVMRVANETTKIARQSVMGTPCPPVPELRAAEPEPAPAPIPVPMNLDAPAGSAPAGGSAAGSAAEPPEPAQGGAAGEADAAAADAAAAGEDDGSARRRIEVSLDPIELAKPAQPRAPALPPDYAAVVVKHWTCEIKIEAALGRLERGRLRILWVLLGTGLALVLGLAAYGIKMTHKVAGPLFKVGLYFNKMRDGRFDKVYNLRKGDQLVDFYDQFKAAHAGVVQMQQADIERLRAVIAAADAAGAGDEPAIRELRDLLGRKEKSIE